ncbi:MAG: 3-deoxy-manno-octulosonate cytidylyltransferase [Flavobacteriales bacterium]|nr:3-deoxy-manno-octulosonate cytidylyltransferase [Flavobacteriales bacterium]
MKALALIPARIDSKRLPGKLMMDLGGVPLINRTYENISATNLFDKVVVVTNSKIIYNSIIKSGGNAFFSKKKHRCGTDRIAEYAIKSSNDIVVNVQGDEPFVETECLKKMLELFENDTSKKIDLISIMNNLDKNDFENTNKVKVLINDKFDAIMFSRSIKTLKEIYNNVNFIYKHVGVYGFRMNCLEDFYSSKPSNLEKKENLEQLRYIEKGKTIRMIKTNYSGFGIDVMQDLIEARKKINA